MRRKRVLREHRSVDDRRQDARLAPEPFGLVGAACLVIAVRRGLAFGDFGSDDLLYFGLGEGVSFRLPGTEAGYGEINWRNGWCWAKLRHDWGLDSRRGGRRHDSVERGVPQVVVVQ